MTYFLVNGIFLIVHILQISKHLKNEIQFMNGSGTKLIQRINYF